MIETILVSAFVLIMLLWNVYLMRQNSQLLDRLMSRDYSEYASTKKFAETKPQQQAEPNEVTIDPYDAQRAREINGVMGIG